MKPVFDEREAIRLELQELVEQKRMDYELYLESRTIRNIRTTELLNRLRELDGWKAPTVEVPKREEEVKELMKLRPEKTIVEKEQEHKRNNSPKTQKIYVPLERVSVLIHQYLIDNGPSRSKDIQKYVEKESGGKWGNFANPLNRTVEKYGKVKRGERGIYYYEDGVNGEGAEETGR